MLKLLVEAGARRLVSGSGIYKSSNIPETIELFKNVS
jgi:pentose-5-phosphate-3-epimerase